MDIKEESRTEENSEKENKTHQSIEYNKSHQEMEPKETLNRQIINNNSYKNNDDVNLKKPEELWEMIGFHKVLAGFWYNLIFVLLDLIIGVIVSGIFLNYFYPFPESLGYKSVAMGLFTLYFRAFDLGTSYTMSRYISASRIEDVNKMVKYVQYFIWYQMMTGLIQTTTVSIYALFFIPKTELAYGVWLMLIAGTTQYPGFLGVFGGVLNGLEHFDKTAILSFIQGDLFQRVTELLFVALGGIYGEMHPEMGRIMGIAIGSAIGTYIDDFLGTLVAARFFTRVMKSHGITASRCFRVEFDLKFIKEPFLFGLKTGLPGLLNGVTTLVVLWESVLYISQYTTFSTLINMASIATWYFVLASPNMTPFISESINNDKKYLGQYYTTQAFRFIGLIGWFCVDLALIVYLVIRDAFISFSLYNYLLMIPFILPLMIRNSMNPIIALADNIIVGAHRPNFLMIMRFSEELMKMFFWTLWLVWLRLPYIWGFSGIIWVMALGELPAILIKTSMTYFYIHKTIFKIKINWVQTVIAPGISSLLTFLIAFLVKNYIYQPIFNNSGIIPAIITISLIGLLLILYFYFPMTSILGGWDAKSLKEFDYVVKMSGPSRIMVLPMYKMLQKIGTRSPLFNKFPVENPEAEREIVELTEMKFRQNQHN